MTFQLKNKYKKVKKFLKNNSILLMVVLFALGFLGGAISEKLGVNLKFPVKNIVSSKESLSPKELKNAISNKDFVFINVHSPYEGEIAGTDLFIEHDLIKTNKDKLPEDKNAKIVLYCKSGNMSAQALQTLKSMGYTNVFHLAGGMEKWKRAGYELLDLSKLPEQVIPENGVNLPIKWADIGPKLIKLGVIDSDEFKNATQLTDEEAQILENGSEDKIRIDNNNSRFVVNLLWALGLAQKSKVYDEGPLGVEYKDQKGDFASTGGWTLAKGDAVNYLNKYNLIPLTQDQQSEVFEIANNVYRPCCGNNTAFPDCNHGMAALAAIELMVSEGIGKEDIYKNLLTLNSYWFPDTYLALAAYMARQGIEWKDVDAKLALSEEFSSSQGASELYEKVGPLPFQDNLGGSCGA